MYFNNFYNTTLEDFPTFVKNNKNISHELGGDLPMTLLTNESLIDLNDYFPEEVNLVWDKEEQNREILSNENMEEIGLPISVTNNNLISNHKNSSYRRENNLKIEQNSRKMEHDHHKNEQKNLKIEQIKPNWKKQEIFQNKQTASKIQNLTKISSTNIEKQNEHQKVKERETTNEKQNGMFKFQQNANPKIIKKRKKFKKVIKLKKRGCKNGIKTHVIKKNIIKKKKVQKTKTKLPPEILALKPPKKRSQLNKLNIMMTDYENYQLRSLSKEELAKLSKTEKNERKRIRDRISARNSRNKQKVYLGRLEKHCLSIITEKKKFENKLDLLKKENVDMKKEIERLKSRLNLKNEKKLILQDNKKETEEFEYTSKNNTRNTPTKRRRLLQKKKNLLKIINPL
ncbi:cyclic amp-responsive element-binding protein [Anaeramoeba flamelloides]|uniref:Cyclic amp-responsive element-binding protein n=1 Tax=Anaeramoeba flamelloides TaxID=1746091 RepID=A0AAV7Z4W4_9EUKA|nr:cyclic amp-responsive element-binding protein [Anaeramoeba flamelloides]